MGGGTQQRRMYRATQDRTAVEVEVRAPRIIGQADVYYVDKFNKRKREIIALNWTGWDISQILPGEEGEKMDDELKQLVGDGKGKLSIGFGAGDKDYGNGVDVSVMVSLTCDQSPEGFADAFETASMMGEAFVADLFKKGVRLYHKLVPKSERT